MRAVRVHCEAIPGFARDRELGFPLLGLVVKQPLPPLVRGSSQLRVEASRSWSCSAIAQVRSETLQEFFHQPLKIHTMMARQARSAIGRRAAHINAQQSLPANLRSYAQVATAQDTKPPVAVFGLDGTYASALVDIAQLTLLVICKLLTMLTS